MECDPRSGFVGIMTGAVRLTSKCYIFRVLVSIEKFCLPRVSWYRLGA